VANLLERFGIEGLLDCQTLDHWSGRPPPEYRGEGIGTVLLRERLGFTSVDDKGVYLLLERPPGYVKTAS
jgi:hypothetical protein